MPKTITDYIDIFNQSNQESGTRYATFDLCYGYFNENRRNLIDSNMEKSCYVLWSYLASWGMLRGSSFLLQMNPSYLIPLVEYINDKGDIMFDVDIDSYTQNSSVILSSYNEIEIILTPIESHTTPSKTLITKIMLGVFGCIPAYDRYFIEAFKSEGRGFCSPKLSLKSIECISGFYNNIEYKNEIDNLRNNSNVKDFYGNKTPLKYPIAKIIDMYGFQKGIIDEKIKRNGKL